MRILVAGGEGYLGSMICNLLAADHAVTSIDLGWFGNTELNENVNTVRGDILGLRSLEVFDVVVNAAGVSDADMADFAPDDTFARNVGGAFYLANLARQGAVRQFVQISDCAVYGDSNKTKTERSRPACVDAYGMSKLCAEKTIANICDKNTNVCILRMGDLFGISPRMRYDVHINKLYEYAITEKKILVPDETRPLLNVEDAARSVKFVIDKKLSGTYNVAAFNCTMLAAAREIEKKVNCDLEPCEQQLGNCKVSSQSIADLGFKFNRELEDSIAELVDNGFEEKEQSYNAPIYKRYILDKENPCEE